VFLDALADVMERAGFTVLRECPADPGPQVALLVDDAHDLSPADLTRLTTLAEGELGVLVVAHRPCAAAVGRRRRPGAGPDGRAPRACRPDARRLDRAGRPRSHAVALGPQ